MRGQVETICATYLQKVSEEKKLIEKQLDEEAEKAAAERAANGNDPYKQIYIFRSVSV